MKSKNTDVQKLLEDLEAVDGEKHEIIQALRAVVFHVYPKVTERIMYGGIMFTLNEDFGGVFVSKKHVSFEFGNGYMLDDPHKHLEGTGKFRRHLKIPSVDDVEGKEVKFYVEQVVC